MLTLGEHVYTDRDYVLEAFPDMLATATLRQTQNDDKASIDPNYLAFELPDPSTVYIAYDSRIPNTPIWLSMFADTNQEVRISQHSSPFHLYAKSFLAGLITLGGNGSGGANSMYLVFVAATTRPTPPPSNDAWTVTENTSDRFAATHPSGATLSWVRTRKVPS